MTESEKFSCDEKGMVAAQAFLERLCDEPKPAIIMDEIVSNIVRCSGANEFSIDFEQGEGQVKMAFTDNGAAFDPLNEVADPDITAGADDRKVGGLGIFMVKKMSKSVEYLRKDDKNVLTVVIPSLGI